MTASPTQQDTDDCLEIRLMKNNGHGQNVVLETIFDFSIPPPSAEVVVQNQMYIVTGQTWVASREGRWHHVNVYIKRKD